MMLARNVNVIMIAFFVAVLCYSTAARSKKAILVGEAITLIDRYYVDPVDDRELVEAAMAGLTARLDEHSEFIPPSMYGAFQDVIEQEFAGIGILVEQPEKAKPVRVITPLVGSPALVAGVLPGDQILKVNGEDVSGLEIGAVSDRLRGPVGTTLTLTVRRKVEEADKEVNIDLSRRTIELESVVGSHRDQENRWVFRLPEHPEIAYVRLTSFGEKTVGELKGVLESLNNDFESLILDVRANSGGLLYAAVEVCDNFLESGRIVSIKKRGGEVDSAFDAGKGVLVRPDLPIVVLIDGNSASASEIVAACLQDHERARVVGQRSFGKGTVQNVLSLDYGRSALKLTTARYYRPNGHNIHRVADATEEDEWGVSPDEGLEVVIDEAGYRKLVQQWQKSSFPVLADAETKDSGSEDADREASASEAADAADPQLLKAIEVLRGMNERKGSDAGADDQPAQSRKAA